MIKALIVGSAKFKGKNPKEGTNDLVRDLGIEES
jgi:hypothetical protein